MEHEGEQFLHQKYPDLFTSPPVKHAQERRKTTAKGDFKELEKLEKLEPAEKIKHFLEVIAYTHGRHEDTKFSDETRKLIKDRIKESYHKQHVIKPKNIPESYWDLQRRIIASEGRGGDFAKDEEGKIIIPEEVKEQAEQVLISDQEKSLDKWLDYLTSPDADVYPTWAKYWAFTSMVKMGKLEKKEDEKGRETASFQKRTNNTVAPFPPLNPRALAMTIGVIEEKAKERQQLKEEKQKPPKERKQPEKIENKSVKLTDLEFQTLLSTENFSKIYSQFLIEMPEYSTEGLKETRGAWKKYDQGQAPDELVQSLEGHPLEWCTANPDTAKTQLAGGDFYVYYSYGQGDEPGKPTIPRIAIRMEGQNKIAEVRGIAADQNFDPYIAPVLDEKLKEFGPEGGRFKKASSDMKKLTEIGVKMEKSQTLSKDDLIFLYEINAPIEGFGYQKDPRVKELVDQRNPEEDAPIIMDCSKEEIARSQREINENTKAYIGPLFPNIFKTFKHPENIYISFPEGKINISTIEIGGKTKEELIEEMAEQKIQITDYAMFMVESSDFTTAKNSEPADLVRLKVEDLGFTSNPTTEQIYRKAEELGLELCPAEVGPCLRLQYQNQPLEEWLLIGMKQVADPAGDPRVFKLGRDGYGLWLYDVWARPAGKWYLENEFVFRLRKLKS